MKIAVYAITKNEQQHVERFMQAVLPELKEGDEVVICDTGSTDLTLYELTKYPVALHSIVISPWRFDDARNASLALVPADVDVCVCLDLDEVVQPGWREAIEKAWTPGTTRLRYPFIWNWQPDGSPGITYYADKIHARHGYRWRLPCHETLAYSGDEVQAFTDDVVIHHHADNSKSRSSYLPLMAQALAEDPTDDRMQHYYARELYFRGLHPTATEVFKQHLANPKATWRHERSQSMMYLAKTTGDKDWLLKAAAECPERREVWMWLAEHERDRGDYSMALAYALRAAKLPEDRFYLSDPAAAGDGPLRLAERITEALAAGGAENG